MRCLRPHEMCGVVLLGLLAVGCGGGTDETTASGTTAGEASRGAKQGSDWGEARLTQGRRYQVSLELVPDPPPMGELFKVRATVRDREGKPVETAKVELDARMPHHNHGMETDPIDDPGQCDEDGSCRHPGGVYETTGFKFHMGGAWTLTVNIPEGPRGPDRTSFVYFME